MHCPIWIFVKISSHERKSKNNGIVGGDNNVPCRTGNKVSP